ncbi:MAG: stage sporulation protein [Bacillales bacterium]|jgi:stage III sporulation protein AB|nr:stage sporulation protein [Bacillales bacterium]
MVKLIGICLVLIATTFTGFEFANRLRKRTKQLRDFHAALSILESEIMFGQTPLAIASERISNQIPDPIAGFFHVLHENLVDASDTISNIFSNTLDAYIPNMQLKEQEIEILKQFGETLGKHDRYMQQKQIEIALTHLTRLEKEAHINQTSYEGMFKTIGVLAGMLLVILFI